MGARVVRKKPPSLPLSRGLDEKRPARRLPRRRHACGSPRTSMQLRLGGPLIPPSDHFGMSAALLVSGAAATWLERRSTAGAALSSPLLATLFGLALSNLGVVPSSQAPVCNIVNKYFLALAVPLLLFSADLRRVLRDTGRLLGAFLIGACATVVGTIGALSAVPLASLGDQGWRMAAALMARHIGGAINYVAVCNALGVQANYIAAGLAADNLVAAIYFVTIFWLAGSSAEGSSGMGSQPQQAGAREQPEARPGFHEQLYALALSSVICAVSSVITRRVEAPGFHLPVITLISVVAATLAPRRVGALKEAGESVANIVMQVFFCAVGMSGNIAAMASSAPELFLWCCIQVGLHLSLAVGASWFVGISLQECLVASNANVGGPTTAAAFCQAKGFRDLLLPGVLVGIFGIATATFLGVFLGPHVLKPLSLRYL